MTWFKLIHYSSISESNSGSRVTTRTRTDTQVCKGTRRCALGHARVRRDTHARIGTRTRAEGHARARRDTQARVQTSTRFRTHTHAFRHARAGTDTYMHKCVRTYILACGLVDNICVLIDGFSGLCGNCLCSCLHSISLYSAKGNTFRFCVYRN